MATKKETIYKCKTCQKSFRPSHYTSLFCSLSCKPAWNKGKPHLRGIPKPWVSTRLKGAGNPRWTGSMPTYRGIHQWIVWKFGQPDQCEKCKVIGFGRFMHWANRSGRYLRIRSDWRRLCRPCHFAYDVRKRRLIA